MKCPDCGYENVPGSEDCQDCGTSLVSFDPQGNDVEQSITAHSISVLCPRPPVCVPPSTPVRDVIARMAAEKIGCVLIEDGTELVGVFSERDVLNKVLREGVALDRPVSEFMTWSPTAIKSTDSIGFALQAMNLGGYRHLPIVNSANIAVGIISVRDILRFLCVKYARSRDEQQTHA